MPSSDSLSSESRELLRRTILILLAVTANALELFIPRIPFLPWLKPGIGNAFVLLWVVRYGLAEGIALAFIRTWVTSFYFGFSLITASLALSGGVCSVIVTALAWRLLGRRNLIGFVGLGVLGAVAHNLGQLAAVYLLLARNIFILYQIPFMLAASAGFGVLTGVLAAFCAPLLEESPGPQFRLKFERERQAPSSPGLSAVILLVSASLLFIERPATLALCALAATIYAQSMLRNLAAPLIYPIRRFWVLFVLAVSVHAFLSYGTKVPWFPWTTYEGLRLGGLQAVRLWCWLELSLVLRELNFQTVCRSVLSRIFPKQEQAVLAGALAWEYFPDALDSAKKRGVRAAAGLFRPRLLGEALRGLYFDISSILATEPTPTDDSPRTTSTDSPAAQSSRR